MKLLHRLNETEIPACLFFNSMNHQWWISRFFAVISRLGDGVFWYVLMLILPVYYGVEGLAATLHMTVTASMTLLIYRWLKTRTERIRPYHYSRDILQNVAALDRFSFPSGHTMHAVGFTFIALHYFPHLALLLIAFTLLVALSRLILGLHYPSDVIIGALIGGSVATINLSLSSNFHLTENIMSW